MRCVRLDLASSPVTRSNALRVPPPPPPQDSDTSSSSLASARHNKQFCDNSIPNLVRQLNPATTAPPDFVRQERALDGTLIKVTPPSDQKPRYRTRKANIASNVLGVCCPNMQFIYVLPGWEGSAHDGRVLRDAMIRSNGLKVPQGCYYLVDYRYCNADGFLAPFRGQRYHLNEFHGHRPHTAEEYFNMKHSKARNVIERCFGLLKGRWKILASPSFFPIETQVRIILACCLLHNLIRKYMSFDPQELEPFEEDDMEDEHFEDDEYVTSITPTEEWTNFRNSLALEMMEQDQIVRGRGRNKCFWTENEVQVLVATLQDMACDPSWKTDGGFKSNYMTEVHKRMLSKIPTFTKQVTPHLESKIKWLKTRFHIINDMCRQSGCQWNDVEKKIACEKQWFDSYCQTHKEAKGMWDFKFPYLNQLELVYGRDRAIGAIVQGYVDAIYNLEVDQNDESGGENLGAFYPFSNEYEEDNNVYFESESTPTGSQNIDVTKLATK
ncbi:hypothetical protein ZIOFF_029240 [Zingiber officinale]|uniref:Transposase n=1 Tax=Zingiber officinale TaxID=94328 RepID=A0A8J5H7V8_ZINOF|nr:hypothetical protein ZIOFF_029240 [Zingiber officinale]